MDFDSFRDKLDTENAFWSAANRPDTYDLEEPGQDYEGWPTMNKQYSKTYWGDWVKAEDYRKDVERLEKLLRDNGIEF